MPEWIVENRDLILGLIALFGAGGAGSLIIKRLIERSKERVHEKPEAEGKVVTSDADSGGTAIAIGRGRDITIDAPRVINREEFQGLGNWFGLSPAKANLLIHGASQAGINLEEVANLQSDALDLPAFREALDSGKIDRIASELRQIVHTARRKAR